jgi:hypothetical protein
LRRDGPGNIDPGVRQTVDRDDGDDAGATVGGNADRKRTRRLGELDATGDPVDPRRGNELDAIEIVAGAERRLRIAGTLLCDSCTRNAEECEQKNSLA